MLDSNDIEEATQYVEAFYKGMAENITLLKRIVYKFSTKCAEHNAVSYTHLDVYKRQI